MSYQISVPPTIGSIKIHWIVFCYSRADSDYTGLKNEVSNYKIPIDHDHHYLHIGDLFEIHCDEIAPLKMFP
jgi:hypothetical protein